MELKLMRYRRITDAPFEHVFEYMEAREALKQKIFDGQIYDAFELPTSLVCRAQRSIDTR